MPKAIIPQQTIESVLVELPVDEVNPQAHLGRFIHVGRLSVKQAVALRKVFNGARKANLTLESGRPISNVQDAARFVLERIADGSR